LQNIILETQKSPQSLSILPLTARAFGPRDKNAEI